MILKVTVLIVAICGSAGIAVFGLIRWMRNTNSTKYNSIWLTLIIGGTLSSVSFSVYGVMQASKKLFQQAEKGQELLVEQLESIIHREVDTIRYSYRQIEYLKTLHADTVVETLPDFYFTEFGEFDWWRYPLIYPYGLHSIDHENYAFLKDERGVSANHLLFQESSSLDLQNITSFAFDNKLFLCAMSSETRINDEENFGILIFATGEVMKFTDRRAMLDKAVEFGFFEQARFLTVKEYGALFASKIKID